MTVIKKSENIKKKKTMYFLMNISNISILKQYNNKRKIKKKKILVHQEIQLCVSEDISYFVFVYKKQNSIFSKLIHITLMNKLILCS